MIVGLTFLFSYILPGWSWHTIAVSHFQPGNASMMEFRLQPNAYTDAWLPCLAAIFAIANRYLRSALEPTLPWLVAALAALGIHVVHRPFYLYYNLHLIAPLAVLGAIGVFDFVDLAHRFKSEQRISVLSFASVVSGAVALIAVWLWLGVASLRGHFQRTYDLSTSDVVRGLRSLSALGEKAFSLDPLWTFSAQMRQSPPELTFVSLKRFWSGEISEEAIAGIILSNRLGGAVLREETAGRPAWTEFVAQYGPIARTDGSVLYARKDLNLKEINLSDQSVLYDRMGLAMPVTKDKSSSRR
jgi:hypothetical protein